MSGAPESVVDSLAVWSRQGSTLDGKFRLEALLGKGGMGAVVAAHHLDLDQEVALKFLLPEAIDHPTAIERFLREARATAKLKSPHVTRIFDVGRTTADQTPYIVMERLRGEDLWSRMRNRGQAKIGEATRWMIDVCTALEEAHAQGIIHRDLKPQNVFLARSENGGTVIKLLDFGISRAASSENELTRANEFLGTPHFMSPEQYSDARGAGPASDIYSLGACLYCLLTLRPPFMGGDFLAISQKVLNEPPPPITQFRDDVPAELVRVIDRCLAKKAEDRFPSARALREALAPFAEAAAPSEHLDDETILAMQAGALGKDALAAAEAHIAECTDCRALVAIAAPSLATASETLDEAKTNVRVASNRDANPHAATELASSTVPPIPPTLAVPDELATRIDTPPPKRRRAWGPIYALVVALLVAGIGGAVLLATRFAPKPEEKPSEIAVEPTPTAPLPVAATTTAPSVVAAPEPTPTVEPKIAPAPRPVVRPARTKRVPNGKVGEIPDER